MCVNSVDYYLICGDILNYKIMCVLLVVHRIMEKTGCDDHMFADFIASLLHYDPGKQGTLLALSKCVEYCQHTDTMKVMKCIKQGQKPTGGQHPYEIKLMKKKIDEQKKSQKSPTLYEVYGGKDVRNS